MFEAGKKFQLRSDKIKAEISGVYSAGQGIQINDNSDNWYRLLVNGHEVMLKESILNVLFEEYIPEVIPEPIAAKLMKEVKKVVKVIRKTKKK